GLTFALLAIHCLIMSITDFARHIIPDWLTLAVGVLGALAAAVLPEGSILSALLGGSFGFLLFLGISVVGQSIFKKEAMGGGDIKMAALIGILTGWEGVVFALFGGAILALAFVGVRIIHGRNQQMAHIPFGPFLGAASILYLVLQEEIVQHLWVLP
ncbi:MAG: A24 family peptidase, partial [bacterium]